MSLSLVRYEQAALGFSCKGEAAATLAQLLTNGARDGVPIESIVDVLVPPRIEERSDGTAVLRPVSKETPTRADALQLAEQLSAALEGRHAREDGICPIRQELHWQAFDEVIRQVGLGCSPEAALLLLRARDQLKLTVEAYRTLHDASVAYGVRKQVQAEEGLPDLQAAVVVAGERKRALEARAAALRSRSDAADKRAGERRSADERRRAEELAFLRQQAKHLDGFLKALPRQ